MSLLQSPLFASISDARAALPDEGSVVWLASATTVGAEDLKTMLGEAKLSRMVVALPWAGHGGNVEAWAWWVRLLPALKPWYMVLSVSLVESARRAGFPGWLAFLSRDSTASRVTFRGTGRVGCDTLPLLAREEQGVGVSVDVPKTYVYEVGDLVCRVSREAWLLGALVVGLSAAVAPELAGGAVGPLGTAKINLQSGGLVDGTVLPLRKGGFASELWGQAAPGGAHVWLLGKRGWALECAWTIHSAASLAVERVLTMPNVQLVELVECLGALGK